MFNLQQGDKVGIISPSNFLPNQQSINLGLDYLSSLGLEPVLGPHVFDSFRYMGSTAQNRAEDIISFYANPNIKAIFSTSGGAGSQQVLSLLDYSIIDKNPKPLFGFSDTTALQLAIISQTSNICPSGFLLKYDFRQGHIDGQLDSSIRQILFDKPFYAQGGISIHDGIAEGKLIGGCFSLLINLAGTPYFPDLTDSILILEDDDEKTYKTDLMLEHLTQIPNFSKIKGLIFGGFSDPTIIDEEDGTVDEIIGYFSQRFNFPMIKDFPYGHAHSRQIIPLGAKVRLDAKNCILKQL